jgi:hypothetical protein
MTLSFVYKEFHPLLKLTTYLLPAIRKFCRKLLIQKGVKDEEVLKMCAGSCKITTQSILEDMHANLTSERDSSNMYPLDY